MDPICHTLVGASLGATGLARKTRYGAATLIVGANLPDVDAVAYFFGPAAYALRRGVTHGIAAMLVWPLLLGGGMWLVSRARARTRPAASLPWLIALAAIAVATHPALDWLNTYGMRWLMPFVDRWYYGDTLFIVDGFVWLVLATGLIASHRTAARSRVWFRRPAVIALAVVCGYIAANFAVTRVAVRTAREALGGDPSGPAPTRIMASPVPFNPLRRLIVAEYPDEYRFASFRAGAPVSIELESQTIAKPDPALLERARRDRVGRWFLHWARFPYAETAVEAGRTVVYLADARYVRNLKAAPGGFGVVRIELR